jgi:tetratricopeptide (TPR) repeat protein
MSINPALMKNLVILLFLAFRIAASAQPVSPLFENLPIGKYPVGFKIVTITDESRVTKPLYNFEGEKETGDRTKKISIHLWYPAIQKTGKGPLTYGEYCYNNQLASTNETLATELRQSAIRNQRESFQGFFGKVTDEQWKTISDAPMMAKKDATNQKEKFPLLIGMLRPLSTSVTNELLASNGYVVAMVVTAGIQYPVGYITDVQDMQKAIEYVIKTGMVDDATIGAYGFSGSGFSQILLAMQDYRIGAVADIESGLYMQGGLFELLSSSNYYDPRKLKAPFLHLFSKDLSREEAHIDEFEVKAKFSERYRVLLNTKLHHWDFATEGRASTSIAHVRGEKERSISASYELSHYYLLHFFNAVLKKMNGSQQALDKKNTFSQYPDSLWTIEKFPAMQAPPDKKEFEEVINKKGIDEALSLARDIFKKDSAAEFTHENVLNQLAREYSRQNKPKEALALMKLSTEFHPKEAWLWNNLASMQEDLGNIPEAIRCSEQALEILKDFKGTEQSFNERIRRSSASRLERLKK